MNKVLFWLINGAAVLFGGATAVDGALNIKDGIKRAKAEKAAAAEAAAPENPVEPCETSEG